jgi:hypothetical protein
LEKIKKIFISFLNRLKQYKLKLILILIQKLCKKIERKYKEHFKLDNIFENIKEEITNKRVIVFLPVIDWNIPLVQRPHQLAKAYARKRNSVVFFLSPKNISDNNLVIAKKVENNCWVIDYRYIYKINEILPNAEEVILSMSWTGNKIHIGMLSYNKLIYEYIDELKVFPGYSEQMVRDHRELLTSANLVVATADRLYEEVKKSTQNVILSPNAGDYEFFHKKRHIPINNKICNKISKFDCVFGYYGSLANWFDYEIVKRVALKRPNWVWVLVGYDYDGTAKLSGIYKISNIIHIQAQPYDTLPSFLNGFTIATLPFKINDITLSTSPVKIFEYMAGGKPVLSADLPECRKYKSVFRYNNLDDFIMKAEMILSLSKNDEYWDLLEKEAKENNWDYRTDQILNSL